MRQLSAMFPRFAAIGEQPVHGANRAVVDAFIEARGLDCSWRLVLEPWAVEEHENIDPLSGAKGSRWRVLLLLWDHAHRPLDRSHDGPEPIQAGARHAEHTARGADSRPRCQFQDRVH